VTKNIDNKLSVHSAAKKQPTWPELHIQSGRLQQAKRQSHHRPSGDVGIESLISETNCTAMESASLAIPRNGILQLQGNAQPMLDATRNHNGSQRCYSLETACICMIVSLWVYLRVNTGHTYEYRWYNRYDNMQIELYDGSMYTSIHFYLQRKEDKMSLHAFSSTPGGCTTPHGGAHDAGALHAPPKQVL